MTVRRRASQDTRMCFERGCVSDCIASSAVSCRRPQEKPELPADLVELTSARRRAPGGLSASAIADKTPQEIHHGQRKHPARRLGKLCKRPGALERDGCKESEHSQSAAEPARCTASAAAMCQAARAAEWERFGTTNVLGRDQSPLPGAASPAYARETRVASHKRCSCCALSAAFCFL